jgi:dihydroneopterin aldolase/2-amino-4-hydroxy-6-hydroxymethyldihydropteridine diphosphokinase
MERIILEEISVRAHLGVTEKERAKKQKILVTVSVVPDLRTKSLNDSIDNTINYSFVRCDIINIIKKDRFKLIETAAEKIAAYIKNKYPVKNITVVIKKFPYKDTKFVAFELKT